MKYLLLLGYLVICILGYLTVTSSVSAETKPQLKIVSPTENQIILGDKVTISFIVGKLSIGREGLLHLWLDQDIETATSATLLQTHFDHILENLPPGKHKLTLEVVKPNHQSFNPPVRQTVAFKTDLPVIPSPILTPQKKDERNIYIFDFNITGLLLSVIIIILGIFIGYKWGKKDI